MILTKLHQLKAYGYSKSHWNIIDVVISRQPEIYSHSLDYTYNELAKLKENWEWRIGNLNLTVLGN